MLTLKIPQAEGWDSQNSRFVVLHPEIEIQLEHSLISVSKWESKYHKAFLGKQMKTDEETIDYIRMMTITKNVPPAVYENLTEDVLSEINDYINNPMTATHIASNPQGKSQDVVTAELIYYWMIAHGIPFECQKWHLNRLMTQIHVCNIKSQPKGKQRPLSNSALKSRAELNALRQKQFNTTG